MTAQTLKRTPATSTVKKGRVAKSRELSLDMLKKNAPGFPVARYMYDAMKSSDLTNEQMKIRLGYTQHSNVSMMKTGAARLPIKKAQLVADMLELDYFEFGKLVAENNIPDEVIVLENMGVICSEEEREMLDIIHKNVPSGDIRSFKKDLQEFVKSWQG